MDMRGFLERLETRQVYVRNRISSIKFLMVQDLLAGKRQEEMHYGRRTQAIADQGPLKQSRELADQMRIGRKVI